MKRRILMVINSYMSGNESVITPFVKKQAESLKERGYDLLLVHMNGLASIRGIIENSNQLKEKIANFKPDIVHVQYGSMISGISAYQSKDIPFVVSFCGDDLLGTPVSGLSWRIKEKIAKTISIWAAGKASAIIVKSRNLYNELPSKLRSRVLIQPNGVDIKVFRVMEKSVCREKLNWKQHKKIVLFNASQRENSIVKNPGLAKEVIKRVSVQIPDLEFVCISNVSANKIALMLNGSDCLLVTSFHEGSPNIVKEAMACNLPVVTVSCGDVVERLRSVSPGGVFSYQAEELAVGLVDVLKNCKRSNGRTQLFAQRLTSDDVSAVIDNLYNQLLLSRS